jgi:hypothetical protein
VEKKAMRHLQRKELAAFHIFLPTDSEKRVYIVWLSETLREKLVVISYATKETIQERLSDSVV